MICFRRENNSLQAWNRPGASPEYCLFQKRLLARLSREKLRISSTADGELSWHEPKKGLRGIAYCQEYDGKCAEKEIIERTLLPGMCIASFRQVHKNLYYWTLSNVRNSSRAAEVGMYKTRR